MLLRLRQVTKSFVVASQRIPALQDVSLEVAAGERIAIVGPNGAGKSTLFNICSGSIEPDDGSVELEDREAEPKALREAVFQIWQDVRATTFPGLTVAENLALAALKGSIPGLRLRAARRQAERFRERLGRFGLGLEARLDQPIETLSGGERQIVALVMAELAPPVKILLLDEHLAALDPAGVQRVAEATDQLVRERGLTAMYITHSLQHALQTDRVVVLRGGRVVEDLRDSVKARLHAMDLQALVHPSDDDRLLSST